MGGGRLLTVETKTGLVGAEREGKRDGDPRAWVTLQLGRIGSFQGWV